jgi:chromosomal replication initiator protein
MTDSSLQTVADILGKKDHTTIIHGVDKIAEKVQTDEDLRSKIDILKKKLSPS